MAIFIAFPIMIQNWLKFPFIKLQFDLNHYNDVLDLDIFVTYI